MRSSSSRSKESSPVTSTPQKRDGGGGVSSKSTPSAGQDAGRKSSVQMIKEESRLFSRNRAGSQSARKKEDGSSSSVMSMLPRVFRRENSDFFFPSRYSAVFSDNKESSGIEADLPNKRRGSDVSLTGIKYTKLEPAPPPPITKSPTTAAVAVDRGKEFKPTKPRRERTEGDILLRRNHRQELEENLKARRRDVELRFSKEAEKMKNRNSRIVLADTAETEELSQVSIISSRFFYLKKTKNKSGSSCVFFCFVFFLHLFESDTNARVNAYDGVDAMSVVFMGWFGGQFVVLLDYVRFEFYVCEFDKYNFSQEIQIKKGYFDLVYEWDKLR